jgi:hypothetical protein
LTGVEGAGAGNDWLGRDSGRLNPTGIVVSPEPLPVSLLTVNFHTTSCLVQFAPDKSQIPALSLAV